MRKEEVTQPGQQKPQGVSLQEHKSPAKHGPSG